MSSLLFWMVTFLMLPQAFGQYGGGSSQSAPISSGSSGNSIIVNANLFYNGDLADLSVTRRRYDLLYHIMVGYKYDYWIFGLSLDSDMEENKFSDTSGDTDYKFERTAIGPTVGIFLSSFFAHLTYYFDPKLKTSVSGALGTEYSGGSGFGLTTGYIYRITPNFAVGGQLAYRSFEYTESTVGGVQSSLANSYKRAMLDPMVTTMVFF